MLVFWKEEKKEKKKKTSIKNVRSPHLPKESPAKPKNKALQCAHGSAKCVAVGAGVLVTALNTRDEGWVG